MTTMNSLKWILRSLRYHVRMHLVLAVGAALAGAVLAAALLAGEALNANLRRIALERIGPIRSAIELRGRYVDAALADRLAQESRATVAPILRLPASLLSVTDAGGEFRLDRVSAYGTDERFFKLAGQAPPMADSANAVLLSPRVAGALSLDGGSVSLRFEKPSLFPGDMPLGDRGGDSLIRRPVQVAGELPEAALGRFSLQASQVPPLNVFTRRDWLGAEAGLANRVNLFVSDAEPLQLESALRAVFQPSDTGLAIRQDAGGVWLVRPDRIFLESAFVQALEASALSPVFTLHHLADAFEAGEGDSLREQPYGFITAQTPSADKRLGVVPVGMADDEVVINEWLAEKLGVGVGELLTIRLRRFEAGGRLVAGRAAFRIVRVLDMPDVRQERDWLPAFPGLTDADRCADWDIGMPMDPEKLNDKDNEDYWNAYGPTPKAFTTIRAGQALLGTLFGSAMSVRLSPETEQSAIVETLRQADPAALGLVVRPVRQEALAAVDQAMDFREIFGSMAFVLVISALILTGLLAALGVSQRREELGVLRSAGFASRRLARLWLAESLPSLLLGSGTGVLAGVLGARLLVWALNRFWSGAIAAARIPFTVGSEACVVAGVVTLVLSLAAVRWGIHRTVHLQIGELLQEEETRSGREGRRWVRWTLLSGVVALLLAAGLLIVGAGGSSGGADAGLFFGGGALLMVALLCLAQLLIHWLRTLGRPATDPVRAGLFNVARYRGRSLLVMILLASGCFLTVGILSMKQDPAAHIGKTGSGSGGFDFMVEMSIPMPAAEAGPLLREALDAQVPLLPMRVREGDEASCLNLNRAVEPRLLGVDPEAASALSAFEQRSDDATTASVWSVLETELPDGTIPVLAGDLTTVQYGLAAKTGAGKGKVYDYTGEDGRVWRLRLMGALPVRTGILQGSLIMHRAIFTRMFPSTPGDGLWLLSSGLVENDGKARLARALGRHGGLVTPSRERLQMLGEVESTYLDMFLVMGGLGVVLGAAGVGLVVLRNAAARRRELAILRALGIPPRQTLQYLLAEYVYLLLGGLLAGVLPALVAVQPAMRNLRQEMPVGLMALLMGGMFASGLLGVLAAVLAASRMRLAEALRGE